MTKRKETFISDPASALPSHDKLVKTNPLGVSHIEIMRLIETPRKHIIKPKSPLGSSSKVVAIAR